MKLLGSWGRPVFTSEPVYTRAFPNCTFSDLYFVARSWIGCVPSFQLCYLTVSDIRGRLLCVDSTPSYGLPEVTTETDTQVLMCTSEQRRARGGKGKTLLPATQPRWHRAAVCPVHLHPSFRRHQAVKGCLLGSTMGTLSHWSWNPKGLHLSHATKPC